ncbi:hypothetical protein ACHQM5_015853 [Ranunculus cassubicifolius]
MYGKGSKGKAQVAQSDPIHPFDLNYPLNEFLEDDAPTLTSVNISVLSINENKRKPQMNIDLNYPPSEDDTSVVTEDQAMPPQRTSQDQSEKKRSRPAFSQYVASISLEDLSKHFDRPSIEACARLKIGQTVLKRKCREFGILRWPYRKIKSLDNLIHNIKEEAERQKPVSKETADEIWKRQKIVESEKELIERRPAFQLKDETKKLRQHIFKRRHLANRARKRQLETGMQRRRSKPLHAQ